MTKGKQVVIGSDSENLLTSANLEISEQDTVAAQSLGISLVGTSGARLARAAACVNGAYMLGIEAGYLLLSVKAEVEHGTFTGVVEKIGLTSFRAAEFMRMAKLSSSLPEEQRAKLLSLPKSKVIALASADREVVEEMLKDGADDVGALTVRELRSQLREKALREKNYDSQIERLESENARLKSKGRLTSFEQRTEDIRSECMALQMEAELPLNALQKLFDEVNGENGDTPEYRLQVETVWIAAHTAAARALSIIERMKSAVLLPDMPDHVRGEHILTPEEAEAWLLGSAMISNRHEAAKAVRQAKREDAAPKKAGRPKKSTSVAGE